MSATNPQAMNDLDGIFGDPLTIETPQPDTNGEFATPADGAKFMASFRMHQVPLDGKNPNINGSGWQNKSSADFAQIDKWYAQFKRNDFVPNFGTLARAVIGGHFVIETDSPEVRKRYKEETGKDFDAKLMISSGPGRAHWWYLQDEASLELSNIGQTDAEGFSLRWNNEQCVSPGSVHPVRKTQYKVIRSGAPEPADPTLIAWLKKQKSKLKIEEPQRDDQGKVPLGMIHNFLLKELGRLRGAGYGVEEAEIALLAYSEQHCAVHDPNHVHQMVVSTKGWKTGNPLENVVLVGNKIAGSSVLSSSDGEAITTSLNLKPVPHPRFPLWAIKGTSLYEGFAKPLSDANQRYPEFMWMPAITLMLNALGGRVRVQGKNFPLSFFLLCIGKRGEVIKSSCVDDSIRYFEQVGLVAHAGCGDSNANGRSLVWTVGSPEGLGKEMARLNCKNSVLYFDEMSALIAKASIEGSSFKSALLLLYESGKFQNTTQQNKNAYAFAPGTYTTSLIACSTDKAFQDDWAKLIGKSSGLEDRVFMLYQPEAFKPKSPYIHVPTHEGVIITRQRMEKALQKGLYEFDDQSLLQSKIEELGTRGEIRAEKLALAIAIDLDRDSIDEDATERAVAIVEYEKEAKRFLNVGEAETKEGGIQQKIVRAVERSGGVISLRDLRNKLNPSRFGTTLWNQCYFGLAKFGIIREEGSGAPHDPKMVRLLYRDEQEE